MDKELKNNIRGMKTMESTEKLISAIKVDDEILSPAEAEGLRAELREYILESRKWSEFLVSGDEGDASMPPSLKKTEHENIDWTRSQMSIEEAEEEAYIVATLAPCPCCGSRAEMNTMHSHGKDGCKWQLYVGCTKCGLAQMRGFDSWIEARATWNNRVPTMTVAEPCDA